MTTNPSTARSYAENRGYVIGSCVVEFTLDPNMDGVTQKFGVGGQRMTFLNGSSATDTEPEKWFIVTNPNAIKVKYLHITCREK